MLTRRMFLSNTFITLAASGCSRSDPAGLQTPGAAAEGPSATISKSGPRLKLTAAKNDGVLCYADWWAAAERGFFAEEGLEVEFLEQQIPADGHAHGGLVSEWLKGPAGLVPTDLMVVEYPALVAMTSGGLAYYVVAGEHSGCRQIVCPQKSPIRAAADLRGKRVGTWPLADTLVMDTLIGSSKPGAEPVHWVRSPIPLNPTAEVEWARQELAAGRIAAYMGPDPIPEILKADGTTRTVASTTWTPPLNGWYCCMLAARKELVDAHPDLAKSFTRAIRRAAAFVVENPAEVVSQAIANGHLPQSTPPEIGARLLREYVWTTTGRIQEDLERYFDLLMDAGRMPATTPARELVKRVYRSGD